MRKTVSGIMLLLLISFSLIIFDIKVGKSEASEPTTTLEVWPKVVYRPIGSTFSVKLLITDVVNLTSISIYVRVNTSVLGFVTQPPGGIMPRIDSGEMCPSGGGMWREWYGDTTGFGNSGPPKTGSGVLLIFWFNVVGHGSSLIDIFNDGLGGSLGGINHVTIDGMFYEGGWSIDVPFHYQDKEYYCGPACLETVFDYYGQDIPQLEIAEVARTHPNTTYSDDLRRAAHFSNLSTSQGSEMPEHITGYTLRQFGYAAFEKQGMTLDELKTLIDHDYPVILLMWYDLIHGSTHYRVAVGYNDTHIMLQDPWNNALWGGMYGGPYLCLDYSTFLDLWSYYDNWGLFTAPWNATIEAPGRVYQGETFNATVTIEYTCPDTFIETDYSATVTARMVLPPGLSLAPGDNAEKTLGSLSAGASMNVSWAIKAEGPEVGYSDLVVTINGRVQGSVSAQDGYSAYDYQDNIGTIVKFSVLVKRQSNTWFVDEGAPADFKSIQEAVNAAEDGDTIFVRNGVYYENVVVGKPLNLVGENKYTTIIDANYTDTALQVGESNVSGFTVRNSLYFGMAVADGSNVFGNIIVNNNHGIFLWGQGLNITGNDIVNNTIGLSYPDDPDMESGGLIYHNNFVNNWLQVYLWWEGGPPFAWNYWDNGYPSGGNYWSNYGGPDLFSGPSQNETGSDGLGDSGQQISWMGYDYDRYPLMKPWVPYENGTIYIRADGSIDPSGAPILRKGDFYTATDNITSNANGIVIERDNMTLDGAGYTLQGTENWESRGVDLSGRSNVTIKNMEIEKFEYGIWLNCTSVSTIFGNNILNIWHCIITDHSCNNTISENNLTTIGGRGILLSDFSDYNLILENNIKTNPYGDCILLFNSHYNTLSGNHITNNRSTEDYGIHLYESSCNSIVGNYITNGGYGIYIDFSTYNTFYHNSLIDNAQNVYIRSLGWENYWDDGYPSGGNYWSDYVGTDFYSGPYQNMTGTDGLGDTPYVLDANNTDNFPLMALWPFADVAVTNVTPLNPILLQNYTTLCHVNVSLANYGGYDETFKVICYANSTAIGSLVNVALAAGQSTTVTFRWDTTSFAVGNYTLSAYATPVSGETNLADNTFTGGTVQIVPNNPAPIASGGTRKYVC